jgi:hypothetical protein
MLGPVLALAPSRQPAPLVSVVVELDQGDPLPDDEHVAGHGDLVLEYLQERSKFLVVTAGVYGDFLDEPVQIGQAPDLTLLLAHSCLCAGLPHFAVVEASLGWRA